MMTTRFITTTVLPNTSHHYSHFRFVSGLSHPTPTKMASSTPWRAAFLDSLSTMREPDASLSTISPPSISSSPSSLPFGVPHVRTVVMRYLLGSMTPHPANPAPLNPRTFESDMPVFTTDVRMAKVAHLFATGPRPDDVETSATGGGGPVEMVFWATGPSVQWRLAGRAYVLGPDADRDTDAARTVREALESRMRKMDASKGADDERQREKEWSWEREVTAMFGNQSPQTRGWFRQPPPGVPLDEPLPDKRLGLGQTVDDLHDEVARKNFRLVVVVPDEVDQADLSDPKRPRRWRYRLEDGGKWATTETWP
jgi:pyridoxamine 5'-phosphate oxidase